jgi:hypothetical protein
VKLYEYRFEVNNVASGLGELISSREHWQKAGADDGLSEELIVGQFEALAKLIRDWQDCYLLSRQPAHSPQESQFPADI